jgi:hypothetical protein
LHVRDVRLQATPFCSSYARNFFGMMKIKTRLQSAIPSGLARNGNTQARRAEMIV